MWQANGETTTDITPGVVYQTFGPVPGSVKIIAERAMGRLAEIAPKAVLNAKIKVTSSSERDPEEKFVVQGTMDVSGSVVRAQAAAPNSTEALKTVEDRLRRRIDRLAARHQDATSRQDATRRPPATPSGSWRKDDLRDSRPGYFDRPPQQRMVVRRKTFSSNAEMSVTDALFDLEVLDYRFYLFIDEADRKPSLVYEDDLEVMIQKIDGSRPSDDNLPLEMTANETRAPQFTVTEAVESLNGSEMPFLFFRDSERGRAAVLYRRYDGHYGLVIAPEPLPPTAQRH